MTINAHTKISSLLKEHPGALETIVSISPKFKKLRNPVLRKLMAGRTSIEMASKLGGCSLDDFFNRLKPLGFDVNGTITVTEENKKKTAPVFLKNIDPGKLILLDVRPVISSGKDPLKIILEAVRALKEGEVLEIVNSFEPTPLVSLLGKQGFQSYTEFINDDLVHTYFYKETGETVLISDKTPEDIGDWDDIQESFAGNLEIIDVRALEMPLPMHTILESLDKLQSGKALFVYHKRIPVFLLPELQERKFSYRIKEISDGEVHMLIFKE